MKWMELTEARETFAELQEEVRRMDAWICRLTGTMQSLLEPSAEPDQPASCAATARKASSPAMLS